jgi:hypothetical protein
MSQLFDLYLQSADQRMFQMRAPLPVIVQVLKAGDKMMERIEHDTQGDGECDLHKNGCVWFVRRAVRPLGVETNVFQRQ